MTSLHQFGDPLGEAGNLARTGILVDDALGDAAHDFRGVYFETLTRIERSGHDVFTARARVPKPRQAVIALRQWLWT